MMWWGGEPPPPSWSWWRLPCPARGVSLPHAHWSVCRPDGVHPPDASGHGGINHPANMCCHCQMTPDMALTEADIAMREAGFPPVPVVRKVDDLPTEVRTEATYVEPKSIDPARTHALVMDLTTEEKFKLTINCYELERRRGYR